MRERCGKRRFFPLSCHCNFGDGGGVNRHVQIGRTVSPAHTRAPEREAARQKLNDAERKMLEAMESDLGRPLTEEEERLALEPGALIELPRPKNPPR